MNFSSSRTHSLGKVKGTEVIEAFGLSNVYYILSLLRANGVTVDNWNYHPQMHPSEVTSGGSNQKVVGLVGSHGDILVLSP